MAEVIAPSYNPFEPGYAEDPYPTYGRMRATEPVHQSPFGFWMLFSYDDCARFLRDPSLSVEDVNMTTDTPLRRLVREMRGDEEERGRYSMLRRDPPDHTRLRKLVTKAFTPRVVEGLRPRIEQIVASLLDAARDKDDVDLIADFAFPLPFAVISEMLGIPEADGLQLRAWSGQLVRSLEPMVADPEVLARMEEASNAMASFLTDMISWKRAHPADDLLTALIAAEENGDVLSEDELLEQVMLLY
ncbi:MAG: cytochrome P450, partial [Actinomycetota bacterium]